MDRQRKDIKLIAGNSNKPLAEKVAEELGVDLVDSETKTFSDGEINFSLNESIRGEDVFVLQSTSNPTNDNLMELLIILDSLKRASAGEITVIIPYYGYARQDRKAKSRDPITAKLVANLLTTAGADRIVTMDLHANQIQGFFDIPVEHIFGGTLLANHYNNGDLDNVVIVAPDAGSVKRTRKFAKQLKRPFVIIDKHRPGPNEAEVEHIIGDVEGKDCIIIDDMIDTGGTLVKGAEALKKHGAKSVRACCSHAVLSGEAIDKINASPIEELVCLDTIELPEEKKIDKIKVIGSAGAFADAIKCIHLDESLSNQFEESYI